MTGDLKIKAKSLRLVAFAVLFMGPACSRAVVVPLRSPFPPASRWEKPLDTPLAGALASDGTSVFAALSTGAVLAIDPDTGTTLWTRAGSNPGVVAARQGLLVFAEKGGVVWGLRTEDGNAAWKVSTRVTDIVSIRLDGNRVFLGGTTGFAALVVGTGELSFDLEASNVRDIDVAGDHLASIENGVLTVRNREDGRVRFTLASPDGEFGAPAVFADGRIVVGSGGRAVRAISPSGEFKWRFKVGARARDRPLDYLDGKRVGVLTFEGVFYELSLGGGDMRRRVLLSSRPFAAPLLRAGRIWAPIFEDEMAVIDPEAAKLLGRARFGGSFLSAPILVGGRLLAEVSGPRRIVALETAPLG